MRRRLLFPVVLSNLLVLGLILYFRYFPTIINAFLSDLLLVLSISILAFVLIYLPFTMKESKKVFLLFPQAMILILLIRAVPNLRISYPPLHDPYYYFVTSINIFEYGTLTPMLAEWYGGIAQQLAWPVYHLLANTIYNVAGMEPMQLNRFLSPILGIIFFIGLFILAKAILSDVRLAFLAAFLGSLSETVIFYQSEYHPQGFAFIIFIFLVFLMMRGISKPAIATSLCTMIVATAFILSHHFSSLYVGILGLSIPIVAWAFPRLWGKEKETSRIDLPLPSFWILLGVAALSYHMYTYPYLLESFVEAAITGSPFGSILTVGGGVPIAVTIVNLGKWIPISLAGIGILIAIKKRNSSVLNLSIVLGIMIISGLIGTFFLVAPGDRLLGFVTPLAAILAIYATTFLLRYAEGKNRRRVVVLMVSFLILIPVILGIFGSQIPAFFFKTSEPDAYYWYSNQVPSMDEYVVTGHWISENTMTGTKFGTTFDTRIIPFYYGEQPIGSAAYPFRLERVDLLVFNPSVDYGEEFASLNRIGQYPVIYDNMEVIICQP